MTDPYPTPPVPRWLRLWAALTLAAALPLAMLGAETTTRGVGMVDSQSLREPWYFFTLDVRQTPFGMLIEHGHRQFGWILGVCAIVLAVGLTFAARGWHRWLGWAALLMVSAQGVFGILRVKYHALGGPELAAVHGCFGQLTFATLAVVAALCSQTWSRPTAAMSPIPGVILCAVVVAQIIFGAITRHLFDPLAQRLHVLLAFVVAGMVFWIHGRTHRSENVAARYTGYFLALLLLIQPILGVEAWMRRFGAGAPLPELSAADQTLGWIRSSHHLIGTLILMTSAALTAFLFRPRLADAQTTAAPAPLTITPPLERSA